MMPSNVSAHLSAHRCAYISIDARSLQIQATASSATKEPSLRSLNEIWQALIFLMEEGFRDHRDASSTPE